MYTFTLNSTSRHNYTIFKQFLLLNLIILKIFWGVITNWDLLSQQKYAVWINSPHNCLHKYVANIHDMFPSHNIFNNRSRSIPTETSFQVLPFLTISSCLKLFQHRQLSVLTAVIMSMLPNTKITKSALFI